MKNERTSWELTTIERRAEKAAALATEDVETLVARGVTAAFIDRLTANVVLLRAKHAGQEARLPHQKEATAAQDAVIARARLLVGDVRVAVGQFTDADDEQDAPLRDAVGIGAHMHDTVSSVRAALGLVASAVLRYAGSNRADARDFGGAWRDRAVHGT